MLLKTSFQDIRKKESRHRRIIIFNNNMEATTKNRYIEAVGRRKTAIARVRILLLQRVHL